MNDLGVRTRSGKEWTTTGVHKILTNPFYTGDYIYNVHKDGRGMDKRDSDEWVKIENHHVPSISHERFDRIQFVLKRNKRGGVPDGETYIKKNIHIFAGLLRCGKCGSNMSATLDRRRADGWRPSIYACAKHRNNASVCSNKYISDRVLGPFVLNYIANIIRAKNNVSDFTSLETLERKLLRGSTFSGVDHINQDGLSELRELLLSGKSGMEYRPSVVFNEQPNSVSEREILEDRRRKKETALNRLKALYLYGDEETSEKDFIIEREKIMSELTEIEARLSELQREEVDGPVSSAEFIQKAAYFIMVEKLLDDRYVDYEKYIRRIDPSVPRNFLQNIIEQIEIDDGKVVSISFKNGMTHKFSYKA